MSLAPFAPEVRELLSQPHDQLVSAVAVTNNGTGTSIELPVEDFDVELDENRVPRVTLSIVTPVPDQATLDLLDPRKPVRVRFSAGYRLPSGVEDVHQLFDLQLRARTVDRPAGTLTLLAQGAEGALLDASPDLPFYDGDTTWDSATAAIKATITSRLAGGPFAGPTIIATTSDTTPFTAVTFPTDYWTRIVDAADSIDASVYDAGDRIFRIAPRRYLAAESTHDLRVGANGTLLTSRTGVDRDDWANAVTLLYRWEATSTTTADRLWGQAYATGDYDPALVGYVQLVDIRERKTTPATADAVARTLLRRAMSRAKTFELQAVSAWWLRPEDTVTVQLPEGPQERHLVARVRFTSNGTMQVKTRLPDTSVS